MATSSTDRTVKVWDLEVWEQVETLGPEATAVRAIAYHKDGKQLLSATADALKVWGCEPAIHHDTVPMDWRNLADMHLSYKDEQPRVVGCCRSNSAVGVFLVDLRKVAPFCQPGLAGEQALGIGTMSARPLQQLQQQASSPQQQQQPRNGIGRRCLQQQQQPTGSYNISAQLAPSSSPYSCCNQSDSQGPAAGPLTRQLSRQKTPPRVSASSYAADKPTTISKLRPGGSVGGEPLLQSRQPGQLQPLDGAAQQLRHKPGENFPEFEVRVPAGPPPPRPAAEEYGASTSSSTRDLTSSNSAGVTANSSSSSSRRTSGFDAEAATAAVQVITIAHAGQQQQQSSSFGSQQQEQCDNQQAVARSRPGIGNRSLAHGSREVASAGGVVAPIGVPHKDWTSPVLAAAAAAGKASSAPGDIAAGSSGSSGSVASAADPIVAAMAQRPLLKVDLSRMASALQVVKGFVARGNMEGAYKAVLSQGDPAVACMLVEALQGRQDAFELNSVEPLIKLLELLLASGHEQQQGVGLTALSLVLRGPGQVVRDVCSGPGPVGVDLSYEQRKNKCLLVKMGLEGLGMKVGVLARGNGTLAARAQLVAEELKRVVA